MTRVLADLRVLDLGRFVSAPYCGMLLADMGAEVIRVDRPGGEEDRRLGLIGAAGENFTFPALGRNKKGITLDVARPESRDVLRDLVAQSDVFLHNYSPGAARALRLTYDDLRGMRPDIIYTSVSCYGADGPHADRTGFDPIVQVSSGAAAVTGFADGTPLRCGVPWVDYSTGLCAALGTVLALRHRDAYGEGQAVDCSLLGVAVNYTAPMIAEAIAGGRERPRLGNRAAYLGSADLFRTADGYVYVAPVMERAWRALAEIIGHTELLDDPALQTHEQRFEARDRIDPLVGAWIARHTTEQVVDVLDRARIPCGVYRTTAEVPDDPQVRACRMLEYLDLDAPGFAHVPVGGVPVTLSKTPGAIVRRAPRVGEHNDEIYRSLLAYSDGRLATLTSSSVI